MKGRTSHILTAITAACVLPVVCPPAHAQVQTELRSSGAASVPGTFDLAFDSLRGSSMTVIGRDTWLWNGWTWSLARTATTPTNAGTLAFDSSRGVMVLLTWIQVTGGGEQSATYEWDGARWTQRVFSPAMPTRGELTYDPARGKTILVAAQSSGIETWEWDGGSWAQQYPNTAPPLGALVVAHLESRQETIAVVTPYGTSSNTQTWSYDGTTWRRLLVDPSPRRLTCLTYDSLRDRLVGFEEVSGSGWEWTGDYWVRRPAGIPGGAQDCCFDSRRGRVVVVTPNRAGTTSTWDYWGPANASSYSPYGTSCGPRLEQSGSRTPLLGEPFEAVATQLPPNSTAAFVSLGFNRDSWFGQFPLPRALDGLGMPGCELLARGDTAYTVPVTGTTAAWRIDMPSTNNLLGARFYNQAFVFSPGANALGILASNGCEALIGSR